MEKLKSLTGWSKARLAGYVIAALGALVLGFLAARGYGTFTELPDGEWTYTFTLSSVWLKTILGAAIGVPSLAAGALLTGAKSRVGDIPVAERVGDKPISGPTVDTAVVKVNG